MNAHLPSKIQPWRSSLTTALSSIVVAAVFIAGIASLESRSFGQDDPRVDETAQDTAQGSVLEKSEDGRIKFSFDQQPWQSVIEFFADQVGFALQPIVQPPQGSFTYFDEESHTVAEAMDILNHALLTQGYTLIRNKNMLILQPDGQINEKLIETVTTEQLYERGLYEMLRCDFDLIGLEEMGIDEQVRSLVKSGNGFHTFPSAGKMTVVETGTILRNIHRIIEDSRKLALKEKLVVKVYQMLHIDPESLLIIVRGLMDFDGDSNMSRDGSIMISVHPLGDKLYLKTTLESYDEFLDIAKMVDVRPEDTTGINIEKPSVRTYEILSAPTLAFQILQTNLEGREGVKMDQDADTGTIYVMGRPADHDLVQGILDELKRSGPGYAIINVMNADAEDILAKLQLFFRQDTEEGASSGPVLFADSIANQISVRGKPSEVELVKKMVADMDSTELMQLGPRTDTRFIDGDPDRLGDLLPSLGDIFESTGRKNRLNIVMPSERSRFRSRNKIRMPTRRQNDFNSEFDEMLDETLRNETPKSDRRGGTWTVPVKPKYVYVSYPVPQEQDENVGKSSEEARPQSDNYQPPEEPESVPGDPIEVKLTAEGLKIHSRDLDALDDMEQLIRNRLKKSSSAAGPTIFPLEFRRVENVKPFLDRLFGLDSGGGGGAGGLGGALGGILGNAVGGGAGDLLSGMLGGGGGSGGAQSLELEGDVAIEMDVQFNALLINNATDNDLDAITDILEWLDQPEPPHDIDTVGENFVIPVLYRDPVEVKEIVEQSLGDLIKSAGGQNAAPQNQAAQQARAMQEMMRAVAGGGRRGGGGGNSAPDEESPKASLTVDERNSALVVTGPRYIYEKILDVVEKIDTPEPPQDIRLIPLGGKLTPETLVEALRPMLGDKLIIEESDGTNGNTSQRTGSTPSGRTGGSNAINQQRDAMRQQLQRAIQSGAFNRGGGEGGGAMRLSVPRGSGGATRGNRGGGGRR